MATDNNSQDSSQDRIRDFLAESDKLIKTSEKSLKKMDAMRKQLGLKAGASKQLLDAISETEEGRQKAQQELESFFAENELEMTATPGKKKKNRARLNKAMRKNLRI